jgi:hypothetical protein
MLSWQASGGSVSGYHVFRDYVPIDGCPAPFPESECANENYVGSTAEPNFVDYPGSVPNTYYRVKAFSEDGPSAASDQVVVAGLCANVERESSQLVSCPQDDASPLRMTVTFSLPAICGLDLSDPTARIYAVKQPSSDPSIHVWDTVQPGVDADGDTLDALTFDAESREAAFEATSISGCGTLIYHIYVDGVLAAEGIPFEIRSFDQDPSILGAVDYYDNVAFSAQYFNSDPSLCGDFDWDGDVEFDDLVLRGTHFNGRHHIDRQLYSPNGGPSPRYISQEAVGVSWEAGQGPESRVAIQFYRDSDPTKHQLRVNDPDDGYEVCYLPQGLDPGTDYRIEVVHHKNKANWSESYGDLDVGRDASDEPFEIYDPGCPFVQTRSSDGWVSENSILKRSIDGTLTQDVYRLRGLPAKSDNRYQVRIFENAREFTNLDQVELATLDVTSSANPLRVGNRYVLGVWQPATEATTASGRNITHLVNGASSEYFTGGPGDTVYVELPELGSSHSDLRSMGSQAAMQGGGGSGGGGGGKQIDLKPGGPPELGTDATALDTQFLEQTGILIQVPDGRGDWTTAQHYYPRENFDDFVIDGHVSGPMRLIFVGEHKINFLGRVTYIQDRLTPTKLDLLSANHSRLGSKLGEVTNADQQKTVIAPGDTLTLEFEAKPVPEGMTRHWFLVTNGVYSSVAPQGVDEPQPVAQSWQFALGAARPNPTTGSVSIGYTLARSTDVSIRVYNVAGRLVRTLVKERQKPGPYDILWNARDNDGRRVPNGVYFYRMVAGDWTSQRKVVFLGR